MRRLLPLWLLILMLTMTTAVVSADDGSGMARPPIGDYGLTAR
jgi:hypothetical protein